MERWRRLLFRVRVELALAMLGAAVGVRLACQAAPAWAFAAAAVSALAVAAGVTVLFRVGELTLAWRCPRLDALDLQVTSRELPWGVLQAADTALRVLEKDGAAYREFFPEARASILRSAYRVLDAHRVGTRAMRALRDAPPGAARSLLEQQALRADREVVELGRLLQDLRARFVASTAPMPAGEDPAPALRLLGQRSGALGEAIDQVRGES